MRVVDDGAVGAIRALAHGPRSWKPVVEGRHDGTGRLWYLIYYRRSLR